MLLAQIIYGGKTQACLQFPKGWYITVTTNYKANEDTMVAYI